LGKSVKVEIPKTLITLFRFKLVINTIEYQYL